MGKRAEELEAEVAGWDGRRGGCGCERGRRLRAGQERRGDAGLGRRQEAARREDPPRQGRTGGRGESRRRGRTASAGRGGKEAGSRRPQETRKTRRPALRSPRPESAKELHRSRKPHHEDQGRLYPGLQRPGGGGRRGAGDRRPRPRRQRERPASTDADGRRGRGQQCRKPEQVSADAGYCSDANLEAMESRKIDAYIAAGRAKHPTDGEGGSKRVAAMREKIRAGGHYTPYRLRKQLPEPVFGQIKQARGFRQFLMRGLDRSPTNGASSASPTICSNSPRGGVRPPPRSQPPECRQPAKQPGSASRPANTLQIDLTADTSSDRLLGLS